MTENTKLRGEPDRSLINMNEQYEVEYWTKRLGCTRQRLQQAVKARGQLRGKGRSWAEGE